jgi:hypothetical protein
MFREVRKADYGFQPGGKVLRYDVMEESME